MPKYLQCTICKAIEDAPKHSHQKTFLCKKCNEIKLMEDLLYNSEEVLAINQIEEFLIIKGFSKSPTGILYKTYSKDVRISVNTLGTMPIITVKSSNNSYTCTTTKLIKHLSRNIIIEIKPIINTIINLWSKK